MNRILHTLLVAVAAALLCAPVASAGLITSAAASDGLSSSTIDFNSTGATGDWAGDTGAIAVDFADSADAAGVDALAIDVDSTDDPTNSIVAISNSDTTNSAGADIVNLRGFQPPNGYGMQDQSGGYMADDDNMFVDNSSSGAVPAPGAFLLGALGLGAVSFITRRSNSAA